MRERWGFDKARNLPALSVRRKYIVFAHGVRRAASNLFTDHCPVAWDAVCAHSEAANSEDPSSLFPLVTHLTSPWGLDSSKKSPNTSLSFSLASDSKLHSSARRVLAEQELLQSRGAKDAWEIALAMHAESPKITAFWNMYKTMGLEEKWNAQVAESQRHSCGSWIDWYGQVLCNEEQVEKALEGAGGRIEELG